MGLIKYGPGSLRGDELGEIATKINAELGELSKVFQKEVFQRAVRIGNELERAKMSILRLEDFYLWAEGACGLKDRQVRNYLRFAKHGDQIKQLAASEGKEITSIDSGLQLLSRTQDTDEISGACLLHKRCIYSTKRAANAIEDALAVAKEINPELVTSADLQAIQAALEILERLGRHQIQIPTESDQATPVEVAA